MYRHATIGLLATGLCASGLLCGCPPANKTASAAAPAAPASAPAAPAAKPADKPAEAAKPADKPAETKTAAVESFWKDVGVGTSIEYTTVTDMQKPAKMKMEMKQTKTLASKDDKGYVLNVKNVVSGNASPGPDEKGEWVVAAPAAAPAKDGPQDLGNEKVKVGGGEFDCKHWKTESESAGVKTTTETWTWKNLLVKMSSKNDNMTSSMELTKLDKK
jgi:hypothetical protein